jgi:1-phosphatidylinositol-4-phosphate 5-kinase
MQSLDILSNKEKVFMAGEGAGRSGSFFFFSNDNKLIIKTMRGSEKKVFLEMLEYYIAHIDSTENKSLLARIYGIYTIRSNRFRPIDVLVMENTAQTQSKRYSFDLKGSLHNRRAPFRKGKIFKDLNMLEMQKRK